MKQSLLALIITMPALAFGCNTAQSPTLDAINANLPTPTNLQTNIDIIDLEPGKFVPDTVLVSFKAGTSPERIQAIVAEIGGTVSSSSDSFTEIKLNNKNSSGANVKAAITKLQSYPEVKYAEPDGIITIPDCSKGPC